MTKTVDIYLYKYPALGLAQALPDTSGDLFSTGSPADEEGSPQRCRGESVETITLEDFQR